MVHFQFEAHIGVLDQSSRGLFRYPRPRASCACSILCSREARTARRVWNRPWYKHRRRRTRISSHFKRSRRPSSSSNATFLFWIRDTSKIHHQQVIRTSRKWHRLRLWQRPLRMRTYIKKQPKGTVHTTPLYSVSPQTHKQRATNPYAFHSPPRNGASDGETCASCLLREQQATRR